MNVARSLPLVLAAACGARSSPAKPGDDKMSMQDKMIMSSMDMPADDGSTFGPLEVGADYRTYVRMNTAPVASETHGGRLVDTYVNRVGAAAYLDENAELPVGTVLVKTSMQVDDHGQPTGEQGPLFVMEKKPAGFDADHGDFYYAIYWADPPAKWRAKLGGPIYWRSPSHKVNYCWECHENYERSLGMVPGDKLIHELP